MRILFVWRFCGLGGVETALLQRVRALAEVGVTAEILFAERFNEGAAHLEEHPFVHVAHSHSAMIDLLRRDWDLITVTDFPEFMDIIQAAHIGTPVMAESHDSRPELPRLYSHLASPRVSGVLVPSDFNRRLIEAAGVRPRRIVILPNAVDTMAFRPRTPGDLAPEIRQWGDGPVVLFVGRLEEEKNPAEFVAMAGHVVAGHPGVRVVVIGDTWDSQGYDDVRDALLAGISPTLAARLRFVRHVPPADMPQVFALAGATGGCLVSTSCNESQPMIFLEAMAAGCPIVSSDVAGSRAFLEGYGIGRLYPLGDPRACAREVKAVLASAGSPAHRAELDTARALVERQHSLPVLADAFIRLVRDLQASGTGEPDGPLVSCIIAFLDGEPFLEDAIASVTGQSWQRWELLLVDDGSSDGSSARARAWAGRDPRIRYLEHPGHANLGKSASRNLGLAHATGRYVAFLDHDDLWLPNKLTDQVAILEGLPDVAMTYGRTRFWHSWTGKPEDRARDGFTSHRVPAETVVLPPRLALDFLADERGLPSPCSVLVRREEAMRVGGFENEFRTIYDDVVFFYKLMIEQPVHVSGACWDSYRQHPGNSVAAARRSGEWHPRRPNLRRGNLLRWLDRHLASRPVVDAALRTALDAQLEPYREAPIRSLHQQYLDACLDAGLLALAGDDPLRALDGVRGKIAMDLDPHLAAEAFFEAMEPTTDTARSRWLDVWVECQPAAIAFFEALESSTRHAGLARRALRVVRRLIEGDWWLRAGGDCAARLRLIEDPRNAVRVEVLAAPSGIAHDIQANRPFGSVRAGERLSVSFIVRAADPRPLAFGVAHNAAPWGNLGLYDVLAVDTRWQAVERSFVASEDSEALRVHFDLGQARTPVEIGALVLRSLDDGRIRRQDGLHLAPLPNLLELEDDPPMDGIAFGSFRRAVPLSSMFGTDRGQPVDRVYIERFLARHAADIRGTVLEFGDRRYTDRYGRRQVTRSDVMDVVGDNPLASIVGDITEAGMVPDESFGCVLLVQVLQYVRDVRAAIRSVHRILKPGGVVLATFPGITEVPEIDAGSEWRWSLTRHSATELFVEAFGVDAVSVESHGNVLSAISFLHGLSAVEVPAEGWATDDPGYPVIISVRAVKR